MIKKVFCTILSVIIAVVATAIPVAAEEQPTPTGDQAISAKNILDETNIVDIEYGENGEETITYEFTSDELSSIGGGDEIQSATYTETTYMVTQSESTRRTYNYNRLKYSITVTDAYGNACNNEISAQLRDTYHSYPLVNSYIEADGYTNTYNGITITSGETYYFKYLITYGTPRTLKVVLKITAYNSTSGSSAS